MKQKQIKPPLEGREHKLILNYFYDLNDNQSNALQIYSL